MILSPAQWKVLRDSYATASFLESDPRLKEAAGRLREAAGELIDEVEKLSEREELTAPF